MASDDASRSAGEVPSEGASEPNASPLGIDEARQYNLEKVNEYRIREGLTPLVLDATLNGFAQSASEQLSRDHVPHLYFKTNVYKCKCGLAAENQGNPHGWLSIDVRVQVDQILDKMMQSRGHRANMLNPAHRRIGIGLVRPGADLYFTNDFGR